MSLKSRLTSIEKHILRADAVIVCVVLRREDEAEPEPDPGVRVVRVSLTADDAPIEPRRG